MGTAPVSRGTSPRSSKPLGLDLATPGTTETPRRFLQALFDATDGYEGDPKLMTAFPTECHGGAELRAGPDRRGADPLLRAVRAPRPAVLSAGRTSAYVAHDQIIGISKLTRLVRVLTRRFGVQERMTHQIADGLMRLMNAHGVAVYLEAHHLCTQMRGVREDSAMTRTTAYRGTYETDPALRSEFFDISGVRRGDR